MRRAWKTIAAVGLILLFTFGGITLSAVYTNHVVHELCAIINTTASTPVPSGANKANPSRLSQLRVHNEFVQLQKEYGC